MAHDRAHRLERQAKTLGAAERDEVARQAWRAEAATWDPEQVVVRDVTGAHVALTPADARADDRAPVNRGSNRTTLATRTTAGIAAARTVVGAADTPTVEAIVRECAVPTPRPGQLLVLAHVRTHQGDALRRLVEAAGCRVRCLPASSPARSPIAEACAKVKALLRRAEARTVAALEAAIGRVGLAA